MHDFVHHLEERLSQACFGLLAVFCFQDFSAFSRPKNSSNSHKKAPLCNIDISIGFGYDFKETKVLVSVLHSKLSSHQQIFNFDPANEKRLSHNSGGYAKKNKAK